MLKHYKQKHLYFCQPLTLQQFSTNKNDTNIIITQEPPSNIVSTEDSISSISSMSIPKQSHSVALSSSTVDTNSINYLFHQFNCFDSQPNQLFFPQHVSSTIWWCTWHSMACSQLHQQLYLQSQYLGRSSFFLQKLQSYTLLLLQTLCQSNGAVANKCPPQQS